MKKLFIGVFVVLMGLAFTVPSFAIEHEFGGYWRVRMFTNSDFDGVDETARTKDIDTVYSLDSEEGIVETTTKTLGKDISRADSRTRLYYTAKINDNLKFVNKFEMDAVWGSGTYGELGADGKDVEVKNSYVDFNYGPARVKIGTQGNALQRSFLFDNDFSGVTVAVGAASFMYAKIDEEGINAGSDSALYNFGYVFDLDTIKIAPALTYIDGADGDNLYYIGLDIDATLDALSLWGTFIYNGGEMTDDAGISQDVSAWLAAAGMTFKISDTLNIHGQTFYATGDDDGTGDVDDFQLLSGTASYYWSEIMGLGIFDAQASVGSCADLITNIWAVNIGTTFVPMDKLSLSLDLWYATLNEDRNADLDEDLGIEVDVKATYQLIDGLTMDVVGAYLFTDDATTGVTTDDANAWEVGTRLSLSF